MTLSFSHEYIMESMTILSQLDRGAIEKLATGLAQVRSQQGRLFVLGMGGSAGTASHSCNDFRKICNIETYCPTDNSSELTARANDEGLETIFSAYLQGSRLADKDAILVLSVGGGNADKNISVSLIKAVDYAKSVNAKVLGIIGRDGGYAAKNADACLIIPTLVDDRITPHVEGLCSVILHLLVSHPALKVTATKWESTK